MHYLSNLFKLESSSKVKGLDIHWETIYDFLYVLLIQCSHNMLGLWNTDGWKLNYFDLSITSVIQGNAINDRR